MKHLTNLITVIVCSFLLSSCAISTYCDMDKSIDFNQYKTFAWFAKNDSSFGNSEFNNQIIESNVKNYASSELKIRNLTVDVNQPDILLDYNIDIKNKVSQVSTPIYSHPYNYSPYNYNNGYNNNYYNNNGYFNNVNNSYIVGYNTQNIPYEEGTLTIIMIDRKTNRLVWKGWAVGTVTDEQTYEYELSSDIHSIFKQFPVDVVKKK